jgi:hypothetical protein
MGTLSKLLFTALVVQISYPALADEWPADPVNDNIKTVQAPIDQAAPINISASEGNIVDSAPSKQAKINTTVTNKPGKTKNRKAALKQHSRSNVKRGTFGNTMSAQANKMATTENPFKKNSNASVIAERRGDIAAKKHPSGKSM